MRHLLGVPPRMAVALIRHRKNTGIIARSTEIMRFALLWPYELTHETRLVQAFELYIPLALQIPAIAFSIR